MAAQRPPFVGTNPLMVAQRIVDARPPRLSDLEQPLAYQAQYSSSGEKEIEENRVPASITNKISNASLIDDDNDLDPCGNGHYYSSFMQRCIDGCLSTDPSTRPSASALVRILAPKIITELDLTAQVRSHYNLYF